MIQKNTRWLDNCVVKKDNKPDFHRIFREGKKSNHFFLIFLMFDGKKTLLQSFDCSPYANFFFGL